MKLQERLDAFKASLESGAPPFNVPQWAIEIMHRATEELHRSRQAERALGVGRACRASPCRTRTVRSSASRTFSPVARWRLASSVATGDPTA